MRLADHGAHVIFSTRTVTTSAVAQSREPWRTLQSTIVLRERCPTMRARSSSGWAIDAGLKKLTQRLPVTTTKGGGPPARSWPAVRQWDDSAAQTAWQSTIERFALDHADCVDGLCLSGSLAKGAAAPDYPWALPSAAYDAWLRMLVAGWGGPVDLETFAPSAKEDPVLRAWWARIVATAHRQVA